MSDQICGKCGLPIHPSETGVRYFGSYVAHSEHRCLELLTQALERAEREVGRLQQDVVAVTQALERAERERDELREVERLRDKEIAGLRESEGNALIKLDEAIALLKDVLKDFAERAWLAPETRARIDALLGKGEV